MSTESEMVGANDPVLQGTTPHIILSAQHLAPFRVHTVFPAGAVDVRLPKVVGMSEGGSVRLAHPDCVLYRIPDAMQHAGSSAIRIGGRAAFFTKLGRLAANKEQFQDRDLVGWNASVVVLRDPARIIEVGSAFSLLGVHAAHWAHFLVQYLPKLLFAMPLIEAAGTLVIRSDCDGHIRAIIRACIPPHVQIVEADPRTDCVRFTELLHCTEVAYLCDHAEYASIADIVVPEPTRSAIRDVLLSLGDANAGDPAVSNSRDLYVAFDGERGPMNGAEVQAYFEEKGYLVVRPHLLDIREKIQLFANAERVVGVGSSGLANAFFRRQPLKMLAFINYERAFDTLGAQMTDQYPTLDAHLFVGTRVGPAGINSRYAIEMQALHQTVQALGF
jgi:hypothetical protein